jgi:Patched family
MTNCHQSVESSTSTDNSYSTSDPFTTHHDHVKRSHSSPSSSSSGNPITRLWIGLTKCIRYSITRFVVFWSLVSARHPKRTIAVVSLFSLAMMATGILTNFQLKLNDEDIFAPHASPTAEHFRYIAHETQYLPGDPRVLLMIIHADGKNVMNYEAMDMAFQTLDTVFQLPLLPLVCGDNRQDCQITSPTRYWDYNSTLFRQATNGSDALTIDTLSQQQAWTQPAILFGNLQYNPNNASQIQFAQSLFTLIRYEDLPHALQFEKHAQDTLLQTRQQWLEDPQQTYRLEFLTYRSVGDEAMRSLINDIPLVPAVFFIMACFTCLVFTRKNPLHSRTLLGVGAVYTIMLSITTGYGISFALGLPVTSLTQILPFIVFGKYTLCTLHVLFRQQ